MSTKLLADLSDLMNICGPNDPQVKDFIKKNQGQGDDFDKYANFSVKLKQNYDKKRHLTLWQNALKSKEYTPTNNFLLSSIYNGNWVYSPLGVACEVCISINKMRISEPTLHVKSRLSYKIYGLEKESTLMPKIIREWYDITIDEQQLFIGQTYEKAIEIIDDLIKEI